MTIGDPAFCLALYLSGVPIRGELQLGDYVREQKTKFKPMSSRNAWSLIVRRTTCIYIYIPEYVFSQTLFFPSKDRIYDSRNNTGQRENEFFFLKIIFLETFLKYQFDAWVGIVFIS